MASDESMTILSSMQEDDYDDTDDGFVSDNQHQLQLQPHNLSRLSMCTSSMYTNEDDDDDGDFCNDEGMRMFMSKLSMESFDGHDADEEFSDEEFKGLPELSSDSDKEPGCYSLPATPPRRRSRGGLVISQQLIGVKEYASENEAQRGLLRQRMKKSWRRRRLERERSWVDRKLNKKDDQENVMGYGNNSFSGESEGGASGGGGGGGVVVITRPKGGRRSLCMDLDEMKACRDLGFELEHERMLEMPRSASTLDTSSGGNSPIANWRISSPGDDPRDVKARLKVWAQAVALASASKHST